MKNRIENVAAEFGLVGWLEGTKVPLPLKGVECRFAVCGELLSVELDQIFHQTGSKALDCLYTFPLPAGAAVYRCEMHVNGRVIRAKVEEQERARMLFRERKAAGHRAALVEVERENLFTLSLGNVQPNDLVVVRLAYFQTLTRLEDWTSFSIPSCPGIRYVPGRPLLRSPQGRGVVDDTDQVPDASRISPPRIDALHPDAAYFHVEGELEDPLGRVRDISSPSHPVIVRDGASRFEVGLAEADAVPDRDFVLRWAEPAGGEVVPAGWLLSGERESYALVRMQAPGRAPIDDSTGQDIYFLADRSGSMAGVKWEQTVEAFRAFIGQLGTKDRVWVTFFESDYLDFSDRPMPADEVLQNPCIPQLESIGVAGGTELLPALEHVLAKMQEHSGERRVSLVLITDGQVANETAILHCLRPHPRLRVHAFGIDTVVNDMFLKSVAAQQGGTCCLVTPGDDIVGAVARLGRRLGAPVLTSLQVPEGWELPGQALPDLHAGEVLSVSLRGKARSGELVLRGCLPDGTASSQVVRLEERPIEALRLLWARQQIEAHLAAGNREAALALAKEANLVCAGAAFVAWDEAERVQVSGLEVYQPSLEPGLWEAAGYMASQKCASEYQFRRMVGAVEMGSGRLGRAYLGARGGTDCSLRETSQGRRLRGLSSQGYGEDLVRRLLGCLGRIQTEGGRYLPLTSTLFEVLSKWVCSDRSRAEERLRKLESLLHALEREPLLAERGKRVQDWVEAHLRDTPEHYERAIRVLGNHGVPARM